MTNPAPAAVENLRAAMSPYGYPVASFTPIALTIARRVVIVGSILWDAEYGHFRAVGHYAKKDGTAGAQIAKPLMGRGEVPANVLDALTALIG